jgi:hypothetical protein
MVGQMLTFMAYKNGQKVNEINRTADYYSKMEVRAPPLFSGLLFSPR